MSRIIEVEKKSGYIGIRIAGPYRLEDIKDHMAAVLESCRERKCFKALVDCRELTGLVPDMDRYYLGKHAAAVAGHSVRAAILYGDKEQITGFFENVAVNRGVPVKVFTDEAAALEWLTGSSTEPLG